MKIDSKPKSKQQKYYNDVGIFLETFYIFLSHALLYYKKIVYSINIHYIRKKLIRKKDVSGS